MIKPEFLKSKKLYSEARNPDAAFSEVKVASGRFRVVWEYIGEGLEGDFNPDDPDDYQHLRFSCDCRENKEWVGVENASYCTRLPISTPKRLLKLAARNVLEAVSHSGHKRRLEELSWLCLEDFDNNPEQPWFWAYENVWGGVFVKPLNGADATMEMNEARRSKSVRKVTTFQSPNIFAAESDAKRELAKTDVLPERQ